MKDAVKVSICLMLMAVFSHAQQVALSGRVTKSNDSSAVGLTVVLENNGTPEAQTTTDIAGNYALSVNPGNYTQLRVRNMGSHIAGLPSTIEYTAYTNLTISGNTTKDITMPAYITISGKVLYSNGDTLKGATLVAKKWNMSEAPPWDNATSGSDGSYSLCQEPGGIKFWITPVGGDQVTLLDTIMRDTTMNLVVPKTLLLSGNVKTFNGSAINGITIAFEIGPQQYQTTSNPSGAYTKSLSPGAYRIRLRNGAGITSAQGVPGTLEETIIESVVLGNDTAINLATPFYPAVRCSVVSSSGTPVQNVALLSKKWTGSEAPPWDQGITSASGIGVLLVASGANKIWLTPPNGSGFTAMDFVATITKDTTIAMTLSQGSVLSGIVYHADSTPVAGISIALEKDANQWMTTTTISGFYSISMQPGIYRLRVRNQGTVISGIPSTLEYTVAESLDLSKSDTVAIYLPLFPTVTGVVKNAAGTAVSNVTIQAKRWNNGAEAPPWANYMTGIDGAFSLVVGAGTNKVWVTPPTGSGLGPFSFIQNFKENVMRDIYIPDQAKGITRVQPSVITRGESGAIMLTGIGSNFSGTVAITMGDQITVSNVQVLSAISLKADISIAANATTGNRDVLISYGTEKLVGPSLLTVTAPASAKVALSAQGTTTEEVVISDGTGTELIIPQGSSIVFPQGSDSVVAYQAPILAGKDPDLASGKLTDIQRVLTPAGLTFNDSVKLICQYQDQDVEGLDEKILNPYFYEDDSLGTGNLGNAMKVVDRDTAANTITFTIPHFSMFRIAAKNDGAPIVRKSLLDGQKTRLLSISQSANASTILRMYVSPADATRPLSLRIYDCKGRLVQTLPHMSAVHGVCRIRWDNRSASGRILGNGLYILNLSVGDQKRGTKEIMIVR